MSLPYEDAKTAILQVLSWRESEKRKVAGNLREIAQALIKLKLKIDEGKLPKEEGHYIMVLGNFLRSHLTEGTFFKYPEPLLSILAKLDALDQRLMVADVFVDISRGVRNYRHFTEEQLQEAISTSGIADLPHSGKPIYGFVDDERYLEFLRTVASHIAEDGLALAGELEAYASALDSKGKR